MADGTLWHNTFDGSISEDLQQFWNDTNGGQPNTMLKQKTERLAATLKQYQSTSELFGLTPNAEELCEKAKATMLDAKKTIFVDQVMWTFQNHANRPMKLKRTLQTVMADMKEWPLEPSSMHHLLADVFLSAVQWERART